MGGFGGGASTGSGGGVGPAGRKSDGSYGTAKDASRSSSRNQGRKAARGIGNFIKGGGVIGAIARGLKKASKTAKTNKDLLGTSDYQGVGKSRVSTSNNNDRGGDNPQGIELAKASTTSATILGPGQIQKQAANTVKGPTTTEMSAAQISLANKRRGRRATNITSKKTLSKNYTLSKKTLLG